MRNFGRTIPAAVAVTLTVLSTVLLGVVSMVTAAFTLAATALIVPGTGTPNPQDSNNYLAEYAAAALAVALAPKDSPLELYEDNKGDLN